MVFSLTPHPLPRPLMAAHYTRRPRQRTENNYAPARKPGRILRFMKDPGIRVLEVRHVLLGGPHGWVFGALRLTLLLEPALAIDGCPAAVARGRDRLAIARVGDVAGGEHAGDARHGVLFLEDVAALIHLDLTLEEGRRRGVADGSEEATHLDGLLLAGLRVLYAHPLDGILAKDLLNNRVRHERDLGVLARPLEHDLGRPELVAAVDQNDLVGELGEDAGLLHRRVSPADHGDLLAPVEEGVAGGATAYALAHQLLLALEPQPLGLGARGDHDGLRQDRLILILGPQLERAVREVHPLDVLGTHLSPETRSLGLEVVHHLGAHDTIPVPRIVLYVGGQHELPTALETLEDEHVQARPRGVKRRRVPRRTRTDYHDIIRSLGHLKYPSCMQNLWPP